MSNFLVGHGAEEEKFGPTAELHEALMGFLWGPGANLAILVILNKYTKYSSWIHGAYFSFAVLMTLSTAIPILLNIGIISPSSTGNYGHYSAAQMSIHSIIGTICLFSISIVGLLGATTKLLNIFAAKTNIILSVRKIHMISGYLILGLCKCNIYTLSLQWLTQDIAFGILFILWKLYFPRLEAKGISPKHEDPTTIKEVRSLKELDASKDYVVFANYVYDTAPLKTNHPAGYQIINAVKNREVDRYIYGSCAAEELPQVPIWSHSYKSFTLLDAPVARLQIPPTFEGLDIVEVECEPPVVRCICEKGRIYQINLRRKEGAFRFLGYSDVAQIGRYFSLSLNDKVTRLYTTVNFLVQENLQFLHKYIPNAKGDQAQNKIVSKPTLNQKDIERINSEQVESNSRSIDKKLLAIEYQLPHLILTGSSIPIMFKSYPDGKFSEGILKEPIHKILISESKGEGLQLTHTKPGKIIMVIGGTGVYPFSDLIDLLFKEQLMLQRPETRKEVLALSPVLAGNPFAQFSFEALAAFVHLEDMHPITLEQLLFLAEAGRVALTLRLKEDLNGRVREGPNVRLSKTGFQQLLAERLQKEQVSRVWICGPPRMNEGVSLFLREKYILKVQYLIV